ncbi:MAG: glycosyltransferase family 9 protein, partial [Bryobacteraceae bacterium]
MYNGVTAAKPPSRILVVRLGAMGDVIHTLPAAASLKHSFPGSHLTWAVAPRWAPLLEGNAFVDRIVCVDRHSLRGILRARRELHETPFEFAVDFQGLIQSAIVSSVSRADRIFGFPRSQTRERPAALFYSDTAPSSAAHVVDRYLDLARAAGAGTILTAFSLPAGVPEGNLPEENFVLACPLAGWKSKQWPVEYYTRFAELLRAQLDWPLVVNGPPGSEELLAEIGGGAVVHTSGIAGLIDATRRASAVLGVDSGPLHLAAALAKPGVALFGPTDPDRNGPYGNSFSTLRYSRAVTSYKRRPTIDESMRELSPEQVIAALRTR